MENHFKNNMPSSSTRAISILRQLKQTMQGRREYSSVSGKSG